MLFTHKYCINTLLKKLTLCGLLAAGCMAAMAQNDAGLQSLQQQFNNALLTPQEKVFVHTDKDFFIAGDILWFKVYVADAFTGRPSALSKVAYVEIIDADKKPVLQAKIKIDSGSGNGSFQLPTSVKSGNYTVRAYTSWMRNFNESLYFSGTVTIINTLRALGAAPAADTAMQYDMQFFPEGGNLVKNLPGKVAFRVIDRYGKGVGFEGKIVDQNGRQVAMFKSLKYGIGSFSFTPADGATYTAEATINGKTITKALPATNNDGYTLHIEDAGSQLKIAIAGTGNEPAVYLLVNTGNNIKTAQALQLQGGKTVYTLDKSVLGDGITHFTVFNSRKQPVCERLYFKRPAQKLQLTILPASHEYAQRSKVSIGIQASNGNAPAQADMSMSVYRIDTLQGLPQQNITTFLLMNADLRGAIENPGYYLDNTDAAADEALDNLMLTHGWSRYTWKDMVQQKASPVYLPEYEGHIVTARITNKKTGQPAPGVTGYLTVPGKNFKLGVAESDSSGLVQFNMRGFIGGDEIIVQTDQAAGNTYRIDVINPFADKPVITAAGFSITQDMQNILVEHSIHTQAQNAYVGEKAQQFYIAAADTIPFFGAAGKTYLLDDYTRFNTMEEVLREYVMEVEPRRQRGGFVLKTFDEPHGLFFNENPLVLVDGVPFLNMDTVLALNPLKIRKLDIVSKKYYYGPLILNGIVSYTTYKGDLDGIALDPASLVQEYDGLQLQREFYLPKYDNPAVNNSRVPDFRDVLYWSPNITTDEKTGKTEASFYTSDVPGTYAIVVNGLAADGKPGSGVYMITVK